MKKKSPWDVWLDKEIRKCDFLSLHYKELCQKRADIELMAKTFYSGKDSIYID